jgi:hypothetical protein
MDIHSNGFGDPDGDAVSMMTSNRILIRADIDDVFRVAADVLEWPRLLSLGSGDVSPIFPLEETPCPER